MLRDNAETLLATTDLVFIDPETTGYSRPAPGTKSDEFHGFTRDRDSVAEIIRLWVTRNKRWLSPKLLAGESYGGLRAAVVGQRLSTRFGLDLDGLILISPALDLGRVFHQPGVDAPFVHFLPTYAAIAHYHGLLGDRDLGEVVREAECLAAGDYASGLARGARLCATEQYDLAQRVGALTGLSPAFVARARLRVGAFQFFAELLRERGLVVGRLDGRFTGAPADLNASGADTDVGYRAMHGPFAAATNHYLRAELGYGSDLPYETLTDRVFPWSYADFENRPVTVAEELAALIREAPHLNVHVALGYYDAATPFLACEHTLAQLSIPADAYAGIERRYYPAGHFMYVHEPSRIAQSADLAEFIERAVPSVAGPG